jgi:hypothetical protein
MLITSSGPTYLYGVAAEHSSEYQYLLDGASDVTMLLTQSETPYWQEPPSAFAMKVRLSFACRRSFGTRFYASSSHEARASVFWGLNVRWCGMATCVQIHNSKAIRSYGAAYECWFHGREKALLEVVASEAFLYLPNQYNATHLLVGDKTIAMEDRYNVSGHFTQSFVADVP